MSTTLDDQQRRRRLLELIQNLRHQLPGVRRRAAANLITKATSGLLDDSADQDATVSRMLCAMAVQALHFELSTPSTADAIAVPEPSLLLPLVTLCGTLARRPRLKQSLIEAGAIEALTALSGSTAVDQATAAAAQDALVQLLSVVCEPASPAQQSEHSQAAPVHGAFPVPAPALPICEAQQQFDGTNHLEEHGAKTITSGMATVLRWPGWTRELVQGGALATIADGALLRRVLCEGWSLPRVKLTKGDEQLLLDFEIRFRGCAEEATALSDVCHLCEELLEDFPAEVFLARTGILGRLLSLMRGDSESASKTIKVQEQAMLTTRRLVQGLVSSISQLLDPTLQPLQGAGEGAASWGAMTSLSAYRYPQRPPHQPLQSGDEGGAPCLSVGGCLFVTVCACTSLLSNAATDAHIAVSACELLQLVQPYLPEPGGWGDGDAPVAHTSGSDQHIAELPRGSEGELAKQLDVLRHGEYFALMARVIETHGAVDLRRIVRLPAPQADLQGSLRMAVAMTTLRLLRQMPPAALSPSPGNAARRTVVVPGPCLSLLVQLAEDPVLRAHMPAAVESLAPHMAVLVPQTLANVAASQALIRKAHAALGDRRGPAPSAHAMADAAGDNGSEESSCHLLEQLRQVEAALPFLNMVPEPRIVQNCVALWATAAAAASDDTFRGDAQREAQALAQRLLLQLMNDVSTRLTAYQALRDMVVGDLMPSEACVSDLQLLSSAANASRASSDNAEVRDEIAYQAAVSSTDAVVINGLVLAVHQSPSSLANIVLSTLLETCASGASSSDSPSGTSNAACSSDGDSTCSGTSGSTGDSIKACARAVVAAVCSTVVRQAQDTTGADCAEDSYEQRTKLGAQQQEQQQQHRLDSAILYSLQPLWPLLEAVALHWSTAPAETAVEPFNRPHALDSTLTALSLFGAAAVYATSPQHVLQQQEWCAAWVMAAWRALLRRDRSARLAASSELGQALGLVGDVPQDTEQAGVDAAGGMGVKALGPEYKWLEDPFDLEPSPGYHDDGGAPSPAFNRPLFMDLLHVLSSDRVDGSLKKAAAAQLLPMLLTQSDAPAEQPRLRPQHGNSTATALQNLMPNNSQQMLQQQRPTDEDLSSLLQVVLRAVADGDDQACELEAALLLLLAMVWRHAPCREYLRCSKVLLPLSRCVYHVRPAVRRIAANIATLLCFSTDAYLPSSSCCGGAAAEFAATRADAGQGLMVLPAVHEAYRVQLYQLRQLPLRLPDVKVLHSPPQGGAAADAGAGDGADGEVARLTQLAWQRRAHGGCPEDEAWRSWLAPASTAQRVLSGLQDARSHGTFAKAVTAARAWLIADTRVSNALLQLDWKSAFGRFLANPPATTADRKSLLQALSLLSQLSRRMREADALAIATATASCFVPVLAASPSPGAWQTHSASEGSNKDAMATAVERRVRECILSLLLSLLMRFPSICPTLAATALPSILSSEYLGNACARDGSSSSRHDCPSGAAALPRHAHEAGGANDAPTTMLRRLAADVLGAMMAPGSEHVLQAAMLQEVAMAAVNSIAHVIPDSFQGKGSSRALVTLLRVSLMAMPNTRDLAIDSDLVTALCGECDSPPLWLSRLACDRESAMRAAGHAVLAELLSEPQFSDKFLPAQSPAAGNGWSALLSCARAGLDMGRECAAAATQGMAVVAQHAPLVELGALGEGYGRAVRLGDAVSAAVASKSALPLVDGPLHSITASLMALLNSTGQHGNEDTGNASASALVAALWQNGCLAACVRLLDTAHMHSMLGTHSAATGVTSASTGGGWQALVKHADKASWDAGALPTQTRAAALLRNAALASTSAGKGEGSTVALLLRHTPILTALVRILMEAQAAISTDDGLSTQHQTLTAQAASLLALLLTRQDDMVHAAGPGFMLQTPSAIPAAVFTALATVLEHHVDLSLQLLGACQQLLTAMLSADAWRHQLQLDRCASHTTNLLGSGVAMAQRLAQSMAQLLASVRVVQDLCALRPSVAAMCALLHACPALATIVTSPSSTPSLPKLPAAGITIAGTSMINSGAPVAASMSAQRQLQTRSSSSSSGGGSSGGGGTGGGGSGGGGSGGAKAHGGSGDGAHLIANENSAGTSNSASSSGSSAYHHVARGGGGSPGLVATAVQHVVAAHAAMTASGHGLSRVTAAEAALSSSAPPPPPTQQAGTARQRAQLRALNASAAARQGSTAEVQEARRGSGRGSGGKREAGGSGLRDEWEDRAVLWMELLGALVDVNEEAKAQALALDLPQHLWQLWPVAAAAEVSSTATNVGGSSGGSGLMCALLRLLCGLTHGSAAARHCLLITGPPATRASAARGEWPKDMHTLLHRVMTLALSTKGVSPTAASLAAAVLRNACLSGECHTLMMQANFFADCSGQLEVLAGLTGQAAQGSSKALAATTRAGGLGLVLVNATLDSDSVKALQAPGVGCARALESLLSAATQCPSVPSLTQAACLLARNLALHRTAAATTPTTQALLPPLLCAALQRFSTAAAAAAAAGTLQAAVGDVETANAASACAVAVLCSSSGRGGKEHNQHGRDGAWGGGGAVHDALRTAAAAVASVASQQSGRINVFSAAGSSMSGEFQIGSAATGYSHAKSGLQQMARESGQLCALQKNVAAALALLKAQDNSGQHCVTDDN